MASNLTQPARYKKVLESIGECPLAHYTVFSRLCGSLEAGLMLSQALYWSQRTTRKDGWFYKTQSDWEKETYLKRSQQEKARRILTRKGFMREAKRGVPGTMHFYLEEERVIEALRQFVEKHQTGLQKNRKLGCRDRTNKNAASAQTFLKQTEITAMTTARDDAPRSTRDAPFDYDEQRQDISTSPQTQYKPDPRVMEYMKSHTNSNPWKRIFSEAARTLSLAASESFDTWMKPCRFDGIDGTVLVLSVPNDNFAPMCRRLQKEIMAAIKELEMPFSEVRFVVRSSAGEL